MTPRVIDDLLEAWTRRLETAAQNLVDLRAHPCYQRIAGNSHAPKTPLRGITAQRISPSLDAMGKLFEQFYLIQECLDRSRELRRDLPMFGAEQRMREIEQLLRGKSIRLPAVQVPLEQRSLLSAVENVETISPEELLNAMTRAYEATRDGVLALHGVWTKLEADIPGARAEIGTMREQDAKLGAGHSAELAAAAAALDRLEADVESDPLGVAAAFASEVAPVLERVRSRLAAEVRERQELENAFPAARAKLEALSKLHAQAAAAYAESSDKVTDCGPLKPAQPDSVIDAAREWLGRIERRYNEGLVKPASIALKNWNSTVDAYVKSDEEAWQIDRAALEARAELRGRLDALKAKARAYAVAEDPALAETARNASALLYARPAPIRRAQELVALYEAQLNGRTAPALP